MEEWIRDNLETIGKLAGTGLCDRCLGRMYGKSGTGMTNDLRGRLMRQALSEGGVDAPADDFCPLCENVFDMMGRFAEEVAGKINTVESDNFLVGCKVEPEILAKEKAIWDEHKSRLRSR